MKKTAILISLVLILSLLSCNDVPKLETKENFEEPNVVTIEYAPEIGKKAPLFSGMEDVYGNVYNLEDYLGTNVLLIFETTFCTYCAKEIPILKELEAKYGDEVTLLTIDIGEDSETVQKHIEEKDINHPWLIDREAWVATSYLAFGTPKHFFIDQEGYIQDLIQGFADLVRLELGLKKVRDANEF